MFLNLIFWRNHYVTSPVTTTRDKRWNVTWCFTLSNSQPGGEQLHSSNPCQPKEVHFQPYFNSYKDASALYFMKLSYTLNPLTLIKTLVLILTFVLQTWKLRIAKSMAWKNSVTVTLTALHESNPTSSDSKSHSFLHLFIHSFTQQIFIKQLLRSTRWRCDSKRGSHQTHSLPTWYRAVICSKTQHKLFHLPKPQVCHL